MSGKQGKKANLKGLDAAKQKQCNETKRRDMKNREKFKGLVWRRVLNKGLMKSRFNAEILSCNEKTLKNFSLIDLDSQHSNMI